LTCNKNIVTVETANHPLAGIYMSPIQSNLLITPEVSSAEYLRVTPDMAGWEWLHFAARKMKPNQAWQHQTGEHELVLVVLAGVCQINSSLGNWENVGRRPNVFSGMPYALYLPRRTEFSVQALEGAVDIAYGWCPTDEDHPACLVTPQEVDVESRGGGNATRQINHIIPPGFDCHRLIVLEAYTPSGNWSSFPPHKHDVHREEENGVVLEADLEEVYFYKMDKPQGYALQRVYTADRRLDELILVQDSQLVLVPEGYHPVVSAHGYTTYYLNMLAGSARSLANTDDPDHAWIKHTWTEVNPRLPLVGPKENLP
jgi:5-deoxy-glucuronate isomerase